jgi:carboxypeptidase C (cathepsin A)
LREEKLLETILPNKKNLRTSLFFHFLFFAGKGAEETKKDVFEIRKQLFWDFFFFQKHQQLKKYRQGSKSR